MSVLSSAGVSDLPQPRLPRSIGPGLRRDVGSVFRNRSKQPLADHVLDGGEFLIGRVEQRLGRLGAEFGSKGVIFGGDDALLGAMQGLCHVLELAIEFMDDVVTGALGRVALLFGEP